MKSILSAMLLLLAACQAMAQYNMLGSTYRQVYSRLNEDPEFSAIKADTVQEGTVLLTCKGVTQYPYFIYEFSTYLDECVSCSTINNNRQVYNAYIDLLNTVGTLVAVDVENGQREYEVRNMDGLILIYKIKHPFKNSELISKRSVFSIEVHEKID